MYFIGLYFCPEINFSRAWQRRFFVRLLILCQQYCAFSHQLIIRIYQAKWVEKFITKKGHLKYSNYASQNKIDRGSLFTRCHLTGEEENQHLGVVLRSSRRSLSSGSGTACQKSGLSPLPPRALCTSPRHLPAT